jgi:tripartite-type tricarboxylate transporter receptor subunit TctC
MRWPCAVASRPRTRSRSPSEQALSHWRRRVGNLGSLGAAFALYKKIGYDPREFASVGMLASTPNFLVVRNDLAAKTLPEFIAHAKANPEMVTVGNAGLGSNAHLVCLYLESLAGIKLRHVPYRGTGPAMKDLLGGQIDAMCDSAPNVVPQVLAGAIRALVVAQPRDPFATSARNFFDAQRRSGATV